MKLAVNLVKPDWQVSWQDIVASRTDIRYTDVTKMSDIMKNHICCVIFAKTGLAFYPDGRYAPRYPTIICASVSSSQQSWSYEYSASSGWYAENQQ